jgi:hypothetical protein
MPGTCGSYTLGIVPYTLGTGAALGQCWSSQRFGFGLSESDPQPVEEDHVLRRCRLPYRRSRVSFIVAVHVPLLPTVNFLSLGVPGCGRFWGVAGGVAHPENALTCGYGGVAPVAGVAVCV